MMKYAIKIPLDDDWLYVTNNDADNIPVVLTYDTIEDAKKSAKLWKESVIVEYNEKEYYQPGSDPQV